MNKLYLATFCFLFGSLKMDSNNNNNKLAEIRKQLKERRSQKKLVETEPVENTTTIVPSFSTTTTTTTPIPIPIFHKPTGLPPIHPSLLIQGVSETPPHKQPLAEPKQPMASPKKHMEELPQGIAEMPPHKQPVVETKRPPPPAPTQSSKKYLFFFQ